MPIADHTACNHNVDAAVRSATNNNVAYRLIKELFIFEMFIPIAGVLAQVLCRGSDVMIRRVRHRVLAAVWVYRATWT